MSARATLWRVTDAHRSRGEDRARSGPPRAAGAPVPDLTAAEIARVTRGELLVDRRVAQVAEAQVDLDAGGLGPLTRYVEHPLR